MNELVQTAGGITLWPPQIPYSPV